MAGLSPTFDRLAGVFRPLRRIAPDGLPFPPDKLIHAVAGTRDTDWFWQGGQRGAQALTTLLDKRGARLNRFARVLDFGCGCGRVLRHLAGQAAPGALHGTDYNPALIRWCQSAFPFARCSVNALAPPLQFPDATFDLVYAFSVLTHLTEPLQHAWMAELLRVTRPGGWVIVSTHGDHYLSILGEADRARYDAGHAVVWSGESEGKNHCAAFHPPAFVRDVLAPRAGFRVLEFVPEGALGNPRQDAWLLERPD